MSKYFDFLETPFEGLYKIKHRPITDKRGTVEYRKKVVGVLCKRAGAIARDRASS